MLLQIEETDSSRTMTLDVIEMMDNLRGYDPSHELLEFGKLLFYKTQGDPDEATVELLETFRTRFDADKDGDTDALVAYWSAVEDAVEEYRDPPKDVSEEDNKRAVVPA